MIKRKKEVRMRYRVNLKKTDVGYSVWVPGLPGCWSQGKTETEALENITDAIRAYLQTAEELSKGTISRTVEIRQ
jgi:predicted RNase H-like HicB family nuclease